MNIEELPYNYEFAQCVRKIMKQPKEYVEQRKQEMRTCNHLFLLLKKGTTSFQEEEFQHYEPSELECVHCGLTNKHWYLERYSFKHASLGWQYNNVTLESLMFQDIYREEFEREETDLSVFPLLSEEPLFTYHPDLLYKLAKQINPDATNEEIFQIMKQLSSLETEQEVLRLQTVDQAVDLLERYQQQKHLTKK